MSNLGAGDRLPDMPTRFRLRCSPRHALLALCLLGGCSSLEPDSRDDHPLAWLTGHWVGEGLGGHVEELWLPERGGAMTGVFRMLAEDRVRFYELITIQRSEDGLAMHLKHFHPNLHGWEGQKKVLVWPATDLGPHHVTFGPVRYELVNHNELRATIQVGEGDAARAETLELRRL